MARGFIWIEVKQLAAGVQYTYATVPSLHSCMLRSRSRSLSACLSIDAFVLPQKNNITSSSSCIECSESASVVVPAPFPLPADCTRLALLRASVSFCMVLARSPAVLVGCRDWAAGFCGRGRPSLLPRIAEFLPQSFTAAAP
jgi:hypothetical protein